jgi:sulfite reductase alpha subunit-like flavoprotein
VARKKFADCDFVGAAGDALMSSLPRPCTVHCLVSKYLDINSIPKRYFWELMAKFTDSDLEREKLLEFCTPAGQVRSVSVTRINL